jgi:hypothetical protein
MSRPCRRVTRHRERQRRTSNGRRDVKSAPMGCSLVGIVPMLLWFGLPAWWRGSPQRAVSATTLPTAIRRFKAILHLFPLMRDNAGIKFRS